jgi:hypothetical protein
MLLQRRVDSADTPGGETGQRLVGFHEIEMQIGLDVEIFGDLTEHLSVLARQTDDRLDLVLATKAFMYDGSHFDGLRPRTKDEQTL